LRVLGGEIPVRRKYTMAGEPLSLRELMMSRLIRMLCSSATVLAIAACHSDSTGPGGTTLPPGLALQLNPFISSGLSSPVFMTQPLDDGRIFVVEQGGRIRIIKNGSLQTAPFLDISARVLSGGERGLLSVAFHPQYATNHFFYVYFTTQTNGDIRIERFTTTSNLDVADPATSKLIITAQHSAYNNHNGGLVSFGPDGMLYAGLGDGGGGGDPLGNGQNYNSLLGSLIRLDVDGGDPYAIPPTNPFVGQANRRGEIWAKGLRNPWRYAFDAATSLLYIADVGQDLHEEVDVVATNRAGLNYGWNVWEGLSCYNASTCSATGFEPPIIDYGHGPACSITGGYVYRGSAIPAIRGHYFYSDYCAGFLKSFRYQSGVAVDAKDWGLTTPFVESFGVDFAGELYMMSGNNIVKIAPVP
jgi:glucose/arabinose dehydrogenase